MKVLRRIYRIAVRECQIMWSSAIYRFCILVFPILIVVFFTSLMHEGVPENMPVGIVDLDHSSTSRAIVQKLDAMQTSEIYDYYNSLSEARKAMQKQEIYSILFIPSRFEQKLMGGERPVISYYNSYTTLVAGSLTYRDIKTACTLSAAKVGMTKLAAVGKSSQEIMANLQPISVDLHMIGNPYASYNVYLSTYVVPGALMIFIFLLVPYSIWTEVKFGRSKDWIMMAGGNIRIALIGKLLPHTIMFLTVFLCFEFYIYGYLDFPHKGGLLDIVLVGVLSVLACQGFGVFISGIMPSLRMSMSICSLWSVVSFSMCGATYPVEAMDRMVHAMAWLFPLRHYIMMYQINIFDGYPLQYTVWNIAGLMFFILLPVLSEKNIKKNMLFSVYIP